jgi:excinuclease ABC subunit A
MIIFFRNPSGTIVATEITSKLSADDIKKLKWLYGEAAVLSEESLEGFFVGPRREMISPWSTTAVEITRNMGCRGITRIEEFFPVSSADAEYDPMLQRMYNGLDQKIFTINITPEPILFIDNLEAYNEQEGLALSNEEIDYLHKVEAEIGRKLTDSEVFGFAQINSEHCRHKIFGGKFIIDGKEMESSLFNLIKIQYRVMLARYRGKTLCPDCNGTRLRKEAGYVMVGGKSINDLVEMPISELKKFFDTLELPEHEAQAAKRLLTEITSRIQFMLDVGLDYLTLNRAGNTLSGGESQRINLVTSLGSSLMGSLYVLDEPSIGLHSRDTNKLIKVLHQLREIGNTVVVVEHDEEIIRASDYIIDVGPEAGRRGGEIIYQGDTDQLENNADSWTVKYLTGMETIPVPKSRRPWNNYIKVLGARQNNLDGIDVTFPLNVMTVVSGVSGSGKSTLVRDIFYRHLKNIYDEAGERPGECTAIEGDTAMVRAVEFVDQNPIGKTTRSNPVTYVKAYDEIRKLFADQPLSRQMGYRPTHFSFNSEGGRCEECKGEGVVTISMQFMSDLQMVCESCHGRRFKNDILEVTYKGKNIWEILEMTVDQAVEFFSSGTPTERRIIRKLEPLRQVGLGYIKLGQTSSTLSGGESQRVKLAYFLSLEKSEPTIFIFDEPTTGLHFHDIRKLLESFDALIRRGHTVIIIEHNMDVIKCADHVIDLGPEGGERGGHLVVCGTPEQVAACPESYTGLFLKKKLKKTN